MRPESGVDTARTRMLASSAWRQCERLIRDFEAAWGRGETPSVHNYLQADGEVGHALLIELVHVDLEFRLKSAAPARVEAYLSEYPVLAADSKAVVDLLAAECQMRRRRGEAVDIGEYTSRFPALCDALVEVLDKTVASGQGVRTADPLPAWPEVQGYEVQGELGRGGMGVVYKARDVRLDRPVALKFLPDEFARDPRRLDRFVSEARTASSLNHPNICTVYALGDHESRPFLVMEFIDGRTLGAECQQRQGAEALAAVVGQAARALAAAHAAGVVHRDIKPENIMVRADGLVKVLDFGLARRMPALGTAVGHDSASGEFLGTVAYASPEQARGEPVESASDVFSLGIVLYKLATGAHPFEADSPLGFLHAIANHPAVSAARLNPQVGGPLAALLEAMLNKDARLRPTAAEVERALIGLRTSPPRPADGGGGAPERPTVGRGDQRAALRAGWADAESGRGAVLCVSGEPGVGKTTLVETFLREQGAAGRPHFVARGRCSERAAGPEAYQPVLEALESLLCGEDGPSVARLMQAVAPTWYVHAAPQAARAATSPTEALAVSPLALKREFCGFLRDVSRLAPVVLFLDDVHWADLSTTDLLAHLGRQVQAIRVLAVLTYRPTELQLGRHPFLGVKLDLQAKGACRDLPLGLLSREDVADYLDLTFPRHAFPADFAAAIHARTEGGPLFMADLLAYLRDRGVIAEQAGHWALARALPDLWPELPESARGMIQRKLEQLTPEDRRLLSAAAVQGPAFDSAAVAGAVGADAAEVEERLQGLELVHGLVRLVREHEMPDRTPNLRYRFVHGLYQQALYHELTPTRRAALSAALARSLERHQGAENPAAAVELAGLYEVGRDFARSAWQCCLAARHAAGVFAHQEAVELARRGLRLVESLPASAERDGLELPLRVALGMQLQMTEGFAASEVQEVYARARELCGRVAESPPLFPVLWGLWLFHKVRSELPWAAKMANELRALAARQADLALVLQAQQALAVTTLCRGEPAATVRHMETAATLYDPVRHRGLSYQFGQDPGVACKAFGAVALWLLGHADQADRLSAAAVGQARELGQPSSLALALFFAAMVHQCRRDGPRTLACAEECGAVAAEQSYSFWLAGATVLRGWALVACGAADEGIDQLRAGLHEWQATGSVTYRTYYLGLLAEALASHGRIAEGRQVVQEALDLVRRTGEGLYEAELHRLGGELHLGSGVLDEAARREAMQQFGRALAVAQAQGAVAFELRAAVSAVRLGPSMEARTLLDDAYRRFTEGFETPDLREARALGATGA